jgi:hypothetical protein
VPSKHVVLPRRYRRAASFGSTRAAQFVRVSVVGTWPAFHGGWPARRGVVAVGSGRCRPRALATLGRWCRWPMVGGRAGVASQRRFVRIRPVTARVRSFTQPPNPPMHSTCGIGAILGGLVRSCLGAITMVGASPPQAGDGQLVRRHLIEQRGSLHLGYHLLSGCCST